MGGRDRGGTGHDTLERLVVHAAVQNVRFGFGVGSLMHHVGDATASPDLPPLPSDFLLACHQSAEISVLDGEEVKSQCFVLLGVELARCFVSGALNHGPP